VWARALVAHSIEVRVFGLAYYLMHKAEGQGHFEGNFDGSLADSVYFSFTTLTTLDFGDIQPIGELRYLTGIEALTGLVLITWTASFLFIGMQNYWNEGQTKAQTAGQAESPTESLAESLVKVQGRRR
jgi:hypothetical protein